MKGKVLGFDRQSSTGVISGEDGVRYDFSGNDVVERFEGMRAGADVDFEANGNKAESIYVTSSSQNGLGTGEKNKIVAALLAFFLGGLGIHKFYLGKTTPGIIMLVVSIVGIFLLAIPTIIIGIIALIEAVIYLVKSDDDFHRDYVDGNKGWF